MHRRDRSSLFFIHLLLGAAFALLIFPRIAYAGKQCALVPPKGYMSPNGGSDNGNGNGNGDGGGSDTNGSGNNTVPDHGNGTSTNGTTPTGSCVKNKVMTGWYTGWHAQQFPLEQLSWKKYSIVTYAFACVCSPFNSRM
jgi:hypothetical protein